MQRFLRVPIAVVLAGSLCGHGCTTWRPLEPERALLTPGQIEVGGRIRVSNLRGERVDVRVTAVGADFIEGRAGDASLRFAVRDIEAVEHRERAPGKTGALVAGAIAAYLVIRAGIIGAGGAAVLSAL